MQLVDSIQKGFKQNISGHTSKSIKNDLLSGLTVALALVPEAIAFAFVAGVHPLVGLYAAFMVGLITALIGGRAGMISGAAGALAVVMVSLVSSHGVEYLFAAVVLMGVFQILAGVLKLGKFIRLVPYTVLLGFVNGLAIVIFLAQLKQFHLPDGSWMTGPPLYMMLGLIAITMTIMCILPKLTRAIPAGLVAIVVVTLAVIGLSLDTKSVGDMASIAGGLPSLHIPQVPFTFETLKVILPYSLILAAIGLIESLLTMSLIDEITETRGQSNRLCLGQGAANVATGFFGGMGGCAMVGQSMINISSGGTTNLSGISAALFLLSFTLFASPLIEVIPIAVLVGIMFMVVIGTFEWGSFNLLNKIPKEDAFVGILVAVITVLADLAIAVIVGVILMALVFAWKQAKHIYAVTSYPDENTKVYTIHGPLFFASIHNFNALFDYKNDPYNVVIDFANSRVTDHSAIAAIDQLAEKYLKQEKHLLIKHLNAECKELLTKAGDLVEVNIAEDPSYHVADNKLG